jgi:hypothetical protein
VEGSSPQKRLVLQIANPQITNTQITNPQIKKKLGPKIANQQAATFSQGQQI